MLLFIVLFIDMFWFITYYGVVTFGMNAMTSWPLFYVAVYVVDRYGIMADFLYTCVFI